MRGRIDIPLWSHFVVLGVAQIAAARLFVWNSVHLILQLGVEQSGWFSSRNGENNYPD